MKVARCTFTLVLAALTLLGAASTPLRADVNILQNPDFETGSLSPWFQAGDFAMPGGENWNVTDTDAHTGKFSATDRGDKAIRQDFAPVPTDSITEVSFWAKQGFGHDGLLWLFYSDGTHWGRGIYPRAEWTFIDVTDWLDPGKSLTGLWIIGFDSPSFPDLDRTYLDDFRIMVKAPVVPDPGSLPLLGLGSLSLGLRRRGRRLTVRSTIPDGLMHCAAAAPPLPHLPLR